MLHLKIKEQQELISPPQLIFSLKKINKGKEREGGVDTTKYIVSLYEKLKE